MFFTIIKIIFIIAFIRFIGEAIEILLTNLFFEIEMTIYDKKKSKENKLKKGSTPYERTHYRH